MTPWSIYASDHGDHAGDRGLFWKHTFYDESWKVPLILSWPGRLPAGERRGEVVSLMDLTATIVEAMGGVPLPGIDGRSFLAVARETGTPWPDEALAEHCIDRGHYGGGAPMIQRAIRAGRYKYVHYEGHPPQLFDLKQDPGETRDLADDPAHAAIAVALRARVLADWDPAEVLRRMDERQARKRVWARWAQEVRPPDSQRWQIPASEEVWLDQEM